MNGQKARLTADFLARMGLLSGEAVCYRSSVKVSNCKIQFILHVDNPHVWIPLDRLGILKKMTRGQQIARRRGETKRTIGSQKCLRLVGFGPPAEALVVSPLFVCLPLYTDAPLSVLTAAVWSCRHACTQFGSCNVELAHHEAQSCLSQRKETVRGGGGRQQQERSPICDAYWLPTASSSPFLFPCFFSSFPCCHALEGVLATRLTSFCVGMGVSGDPIMVFSPFQCSAVPDFRGLGVCGRQGVQGGGCVRKVSASRRDRCLFH
ncbi:hypothetical protein V8C44DRAFT_4116 [Trichoderma aethiopicum]